ncbi:ZAR1 protein, partial [Calonectris borealis]|nr:ZAR1 protein [Calonectris borealis]
AAEYFDNYQRAQLKAILSQVNPNLTPRLRKANTKEVGVQVNPRQDASVQCSLGPRTLLRRRPGPPAGPRTHEAERERAQEQGSPATTSTRAVRFPRTIAVYSPMASRRLTAFLEEPGPEPERRLQQEEAAAAAAVEEEPAALREQREAEAAAAPAPSSNGCPRQFLEQKYGYYHCKDCNIRWESAYVWCVQGTNKVGQGRLGSPRPGAAPRPPLPPRPPPQVYFRQFCRTCQKSYNPYRVEDITCQVRHPSPAPGRPRPRAVPADRRLLPQSCKQTRCTCPVKMRHVDPKRPHRQDLCGRCKGKRLSCDSTFSFKYII